MKSFNLRLEVFSRKRYLRLEMFYFWLKLFYFEAKKISLRMEMFILSSEMIILTLEMVYSEVRNVLFFSWNFFSGWKCFILRLEMFYSLVGNGWLRSTCILHVTLLLPLAAEWNCIQSCSCLWWWYSTTPNLYLQKNQENIKQYCEPNVSNDTFVWVKILIQLSSA